MASTLDQLYDDETQSSDWTNERHASPVVKRHCSEPTHSNQKFDTNSVEASISPPPSTHHQLKCPWCSKGFEPLEDEIASEYDALKEHLALMHPQIANLSPYDILSKKELDIDATIDAEDEVNGDGSNYSASNLATVTAPATNADVTPLGNEDNSDHATKAHVTDAIDSKLHDIQRQQAHLYVEKHLMDSWDLHDVRRFSKDYDETTAELRQTWCYVFEESKASDKKTIAKIPSRPDPYLSATVARGDFLKLTPAEDFLDMVKDFETMPTDELYVASANVAHALKSWQDEWVAIEEINKRLSRKTAKKSANPRALDPPEVFQDKREAMLYGYKYDSTIHDPKKRDPKKDFMFKCQDPFTQGGFRPTAAQLRKMQAEVGSNNPNPDGFKPMIRHGQEYVPRLQEPPLTPFEGRGVTSRKRKVPQSEVAALRQMSGHDSTTPVIDSDIDGQPFKRLTRSIISKVVEAPQTKTAPPSPGLRGRGIRGGRGRGRGGISKAPRSSQMASTKPIVPSAVDIPTDDTISNGLGAASSLSRAVTTSPPTDGLVSDQASAVDHSPANLAPAPKPPLAPATPGAPPALAALPPNLVHPGEVVDDTELNRRKLLAKSKNPRRTQAMLEHWKRFNKEGRTRNPKRTKAQIEADKRAEAERRAIEPQKPATPVTKTRKRKTATGDAADGPAVKQPRTMTAPLGTAVSLQPAPLQPAHMSTPSATMSIVPNSAVITSQSRFIPPSAPPSRPLSPQGFLAPHTSGPAAAAQGQPARPLQPVLPSFDRNTGPPLWAGPSRYYSYANPPPPPPPYPPYGQSPYPPPQVHQPPRHDVGPPEALQPGQKYPYDVFRPLTHLQNGPPIQRP